MNKRDFIEDLKLPAPLQYAQAILKRLSIARKNELKETLGPDSKSQLTVNYIDGIPKNVNSIVLSTQHFDEKLSSNVKRNNFTICFRNFT